MKKTRFSHLLSRHLSSLHAVVFLLSETSLDASRILALPASIERRYFSRSQSHGKKDFSNVFYCFFFIIF